MKNLIMNVFTPLLQRIRALEYSLGLIADYVVEQGTSNGWKYVKWHSGNIEAFQVADFVRSGNSSAQVTSTTDINTMFGINNASPSNTMIQCANGNAITQSAHIEGTTVDTAGNWYVLFDRAVTGTITINSYLQYYA